MRLGTTNIWLSVNRSHELYFARSGWRFMKRIDQEPDKSELKRVYDTFRKRKYTNDEKMKVFQEVMTKLNISYNIDGIDGYTIDQVITDDIDSTIEKHELSSEEILKTELQHLIDFFSEFSFEPNFRFVNTFHNFVQKSSTSAREYIKNYFELTDSQYAESIIEKMKSEEFKVMCDNFKKVNSTKRINSRFKLYYGSAGTGKTTKALLEANNACVTCHSAMLPSDLMEDFKFVDGKATFVPSALQIAMTEGKRIVLDEINLLPFESLRFLQTILDGKKEFIYKGKTITIADGFKVIGTMNLVVNGSTYALPEPLVDRAEELVKYKLNADDLVSAII